jgi:hypothetical protein
MISPIIPTPEILPVSVNVQLADHLGAQKAAIINEWLDRVHGDAAIIASERLNTDALKNHLPEIFDDLTNTLRLYGNEVVAEQSVKDAGEHGAARLRQGYELPEMLRELMHLRAILNYQLRQFEDMHVEFGAASRLFISTTLHRFIDEMMIDATEEFLWSQLSLQDQIHQGRIKW